MKRPIRILSQHQNILLEIKIRNGLKELRFENLRVGKVYVSIFSRTWNIN